MIQDKGQRAVKSLGFESDMQAFWLYRSALWPQIQSLNSLSFSYISYLKAIVAEMKWQNECKVTGMCMPLHKHFLFPSVPQFLLIVSQDIVSFFNMQSGIERKKNSKFLSAGLKNLYALYHLKSGENRFYISSILRFILNLKRIYNKVVF